MPKDRKQKTVIRVCANCSGRGTITKLAGFGGCRKYKCGLCKGTGFVEYKVKAE